MIVITCAFALALATQDAECPIGDNACEAARFEERARASKTPKERALRLHGAYLSYLSLYDKTGDVQHLCNARRTFEASVSIQGQPESQRASFEVERPKLKQREATRGVRCGETRARTTNEAPRVATAAPPRAVGRPGETAPSAAAPSPTSPVPASSLAPAPSASPTPAPSSATPPTPASARPRPSVALLEPEPAASRPDPLLPVPRPRRAPESRPGRPLVVAGGATLGLGMALAGVAGYAGGRALIAYREAVALHDSVVGPPDVGARARDQALAAEFRTMNALALGTALTGGAAVIVGVVMSAVGGRRLARAGSRTALFPAPGGLALRARF